MNDNVTTNEIGEPTARPQPKVVAAASGAAFGAALTTLILWGIETSTKIDLPEAVEGAALVIITTGIAFLAGYIKRPTGIS